MGNDMPRCVWTEWEFVKQLGRGAYGTVYEAVRRDEYGVEGRAAIKVISIPQDESELDTLRTEGLDPDASRTYIRNMVDAFVNEIKLMITLKGVPNIVSVEDYKVVERTDGIGWDLSIRMELLTPLYTYISDKTLTEEEVVKLGSDICSALEICAKKNIIHRDIKPGNIFINDFGDFKLGDFGIARQMEAMTTDLSRKGTGSYMAPEVERGGSYSVTADLYSLGLVLYFLTNKNRLPFLDPNKQILTPNEREAAIRLRLDGETLPPPCDASPRMAAVIDCACAFNPHRRFASATAMKNALLSVVDRSSPSGTTEPVRAAAPAVSAAAPTAASAPSAAKTGKTKKRRRFWLPAICIIAAAVVCAIVAMNERWKIRNDRYDNLVQQQVEYRENGDGGMEQQAYEQASQLFPNRLESLYQHAWTLHDLPSADGLPDYSACIRFIEDDILENNDIDQTSSRMADVYYLYADSLFQTGNYSGAVDAYEKLFEIGTDNAFYYRDDAIALAYDGQSGKAETVLNEAEALGLGDDSIYFTRGEVEKTRSEYTDALNDFAECIRISDDENLITRAYLSRADIYITLDQLESAREELQHAKNYNSEKTPQVLQKLILVDIDLADEVSYDTSQASAYRKEAISTLNLVIANGWATFTTYNNLVIMYQEEGRLSEAENILLSIKEDYASDYRWYKRYAFLEIAKQETMAKESRNYTAFEQYYNEAKELYQSYLSRGGTADNGMSVLESQYAEVKSGGWLG